MRNMFQGVRSAPLPSKREAQHLRFLGPPVCTHTHTAWEIGIKLCMAMKLYVRTIFTRSATPVALANYMNDDVSSIYSSQCC